MTQSIRDVAHELFDAEPAALREAAKRILSAYYHDGDIGAAAAELLSALNGANTPRPKSADAKRPFQCRAEGDDRVRPAQNMADLQSLKTPPEAMSVLRAALATPQLTADERVAEHMRCVDDFVRASTGHFAQSAKAMREAIEQSARALLSASQDDAKQEALRLMRLLSENARADVMSNFCKHCGSDNPRCQCWNDE